MRRCEAAAAASDSSSSGAEASDDDECGAEERGVTSTKARGRGATGSACSDASGATVARCLFH